MSGRALVVTTISAPNLALRALAAGAQREKIPFFVIGDTKSPSDFSLDGAQFISLSQQDVAFPALSRALPRGHYARKNIGYLLAIQSGAEEIQETDDDNIPRAEFWAPAVREFEVLTSDTSWFNVYRLFSDELIWPRGLPLQFIQQSSRFDLQSANGHVAAAIQQGLADENPDVDAVFRLTRSLPLNFRIRSPVLLAPRVWCPFNSQNTWFARSAFPLLYLPSFCTFRMTDIWRSFVAQRCLWEQGEGVLFRSPTVHQERNEHSLLRDFEDEVPGYLLNDKIRLALDELSLDARDTHRNILLCYEELVRQKWISDNELPLLREWSRAIEQMS